MLRRTLCWGLQSLRVDNGQRWFCAAPAPPRPTPFRAVDQQPDDESPTFFGAIDVLRAAGASLHGIGVEELSRGPEAVERMATAWDEFARRDRRTGTV